MVRTRYTCYTLEHVTRQHHLAKSCNFLEEDNMIRDHIVFTCPDARLQERLLRETDLTLAKAITLPSRRSYTRANQNTVFY